MILTSFTNTLLAQRSSCVIGFRSSVCNAVLIELTVKLPSLSLTRRLHGQLRHSLHTYIIVHVLCAFNFT